MGNSTDVVFCLTLTGCREVHRAQAGLGQGIHSQGPRGVLHQAVRQGARDVPARFNARPAERGAQRRAHANARRDSQGVHGAG